MHMSQVRAGHSQEAKVKSKQTIGIFVGVIKDMGKLLSGAWLERKEGYLNQDPLHPFPSQWLFRRKQLLRMQLAEEDQWKASWHCEASAFPITAAPILERCCCCASGRFTPLFHAGIFQLAWGRSYCFCSWRRWESVDQVDSQTHGLKGLFQPRWFRDSKRTTQAGFGDVTLCLTWNQPTTFAKPLLETLQGERGDSSFGVGPRWVSLCGWVNPSRMTDGETSDKH